MDTQAPSNNNKPKKILVIMPAWLGDIVMAQSLLRELKKYYPNSQIDALVPKFATDVVSLMHEVSSIIHSNTSHRALNLTTRLRLAKEIKERKYDIAFILPNSWKSALIPFLARIPIRAGFLGEMRLGLLTHWQKLDKGAISLMVQRYAFLSQIIRPVCEQQSQKNYVRESKLNSDNLPKLNISETLKKSVYEYLPNKKEIIALCPGAAFGPAKRWSPTSFANLAHSLIKRGFVVILVGSAQEHQIAKEILQQVQNLQLNNQSTEHHIESRIYDFCGKVDLLSSIALLSLTKVVVCHDSGLMHIACALDIPTLAIFGPTSTTHTPPLSDKSHVLQTKLECQPCFQRTCPLKHHECMKQITYNQILEHIYKLTS